jgi:hypothetical protein
LWSKLDDALLDHRKVIAAGDRIGKNGAVLAIGLYCIGLMWTNKQLSDGYLPTGVVKRFPCEQPLKMAQALVGARLWEKAKGGFKIHDFHDWNFTAHEIQLRRKAERERKRKGGRNSHGIR